jgi:hypothetical protein
MENGNKNGMITTTVYIISNSGRTSLAPTKIPYDANSITVFHHHSSLYLQQSS